MREHQTNHSHAAIQSKEQTPIMSKPRMKVMETHYLESPLFNNLTRVTEGGEKMNKVTMVAIAALTAFVAFCGYRASVTVADYFAAGNMLWRSQHPPPVSPEEIRNDRAAMYFVAAKMAKADEAMKVNGKSITTRPLTKTDQRTIEHARMRKLYNVHEIKLAEQKTEKPFCPWCPRASVLQHTE